MEISEQSLRALTRSVDETHRSGMASMRSDIEDLHNEMGPGRTPHSRRQFMARIAATSAVIVIGSQVIPVKRLLPSSFGAASGDAGIAAFAQSVELAAVAAYTAAGATGKVKTPGVLTAATTFAGHHKEHAAAFGAAAGSAAVTQPNPKLLAAVGGQLSGAADEKAILKIAYDLENAAASTYLFALGALTSQAALALTASILPVESQHAVVLGQVLGLAATDFVPKFETVTAAVKPADYPVGS